MMAAWEASAAASDTGLLALRLPALAKHGHGVFRAPSFFNEGGRGEYLSEAPRRRRAGGQTRRRPPRGARAALRKDGVGCPALELHTAIASNQLMFCLGMTFLPRTDTPDDFARQLDFVKLALTGIPLQVGKTPKPAPTIHNQAGHRIKEAAACRQGGVQNHGSIFPRVSARTRSTFLI
jgi:hypothetical protein